MLAFLFRPMHRPIDVAAVKPTPAVEKVPDVLDARIHELTAEHLLAAESHRRSRPTAVVNVQEQRDRAALVLIYEGDGYARGKRSSDAIASYQRAIALFC